MLALCGALTLVVSVNSPARDLEKCLAGFDFTGAIEVCDSLLAAEQEPSQRREIVMTKARCFKRLLRYQEAVETLHPYFKTEDLELSMEYVDCFMKDGNPADAVYFYDLIAQTHTDNFYVLMQLCAASVKARDWQVCIGTGKKALELSQSPLVMSQIGFAYNNIGQKDSSMVYYRKAYAANPLKAGYLSSICNLLLADRKFDEVQSLTAEYLERRPESVEIVPVYGLASYFCKDYKNAAPAFQFMKDIGDETYATYYYLGLSQLKLKKTKDAAVNLRLAWQKDSSDVNLAIYRADAYKFSEPDSAMLMLNKASRMLTPDSTVVATVAFDKGAVLVRKGDYRSALTFYLEAYNSNPSKTGTVNHIANCYEHLKDWKNAVVWYEKYLKLAKRGSDSWEYAKEGLDYCKAQLFMEEK